MQKFGLIGKKLGHSFSKKYFTEKFEREHIEAIYELYELQSAEQVIDLIKEEPQLKGLNVTIPYKLDVMPLLHRIDDKAKAIGAVNVIKISHGKLTGYNSDYYGFRDSLLTWLGNSVNNIEALILGTGGAAKAVKKALLDMNIPFRTVSSSGNGDYAYADFNGELLQKYKLIINTTPLGMFPDNDTAPDLPYHLMDETFYLYDLVYNPVTTLFMKKGSENGAKAKNGMEMLELQALKSWEIWN